LFILNLSCSAEVNSNEIYIRANQLGFLPNDLKTAVIFSNLNLKGQKYFIKDKKTNKTINEFQIGENLGSAANYNNNYIIDFSNLRRGGEYYIEILGNKSHKFSISEILYNNIVDSLLLFFKVQRCGP